MYAFVHLESMTSYHIKNPIPSVNAYLIEEKPRQISSRFDLKRRSLMLFKQGPQQEEEEERENKMSSAVESVPDP